MPRLAQTPTADVEGELFRFSRTVAANPELELALGSRLGDDSAKAVLIETLLQGRASEPTVVIVSSLARQPRERRIRQLLDRAMSLVADQRGRAVATVVSAVPLSDAQTVRLTAALSQRYGADVSLNAVVDPTVIGGVRVQIADDVIDASVVIPHLRPPQAAGRITQISRPSPGGGLGPRPHRTKEDNGRTHYQPRRHP